MALRGNNARFNVSPHFRVSGVASVAGAGLYLAHGNKYITGRLRNFVSEVPLASYPDGNTHPVAWIMPQTAGGMSSHNSATMAFTFTGSGAEGLNGTGTSSIVFNADAIGELIVSGDGTATIVFSTTGTALASLDGTGTALMSFDATGTIGALAFNTATATMTFTGSLEPYGIGHMTGDTEDDTVLTTAGIANAVWTQVIEAGYTSEQILRLLAAHAAGSATGLEGADPQFVGLDGVTVRIDGTYVLGTRTIDALDAT